MAEGAAAVTERQRYSSCSVQSCRNESVQNDPPAFYSFPKEPQRCAVWVRRCNRADISESFKRYGPRRLHLRNKICSQHFREDHFRDPDNKHLGLTSDAVPTINRVSSQSEDDSSADENHNENQIYYDSTDSSSDLSEPSSGPDVPSLKKRLLDGQRLNSRLRRAIERLRRQNTKYKEKLVLRSTGAWVRYTMQTTSSSSEAQPMMMMM